jgi:hypothetical protein
MSKQLHNQQMTRIIPHYLRIKKRDAYYEDVRLIKDNRKKVLINKKYEVLTLNEKRSYIGNAPAEIKRKNPTKRI